MKSSPRLVGWFAVFCGQLFFGAIHALGEPPWASDRVLIGLRAPGSESATKSFASRSTDEWRERLGLASGVVLRSMHAHAGKTLSRTEAMPLDRPVVVELGGTLSVEEALQVLRGRPEVIYAEPDYVGKGGAVPNDPNYSLEWHHQKIQSEAAWSISTGNSDVIVAILDTGLNENLAEFSGRIVQGYDYANDDDDPADDVGHGTVVAGILAANANNNQLVAGMNWQCRILPEKVLDETNFGFYSRWAQAIYDATDAGAKVMNLSAGGDNDSAALTAAIDYAIGKGVIFVTITHNQGTDVITFPGRLPQCITAGGTERNDTRASFSNYGPEIDLVAPARDIYSVDNTGALFHGSGTSFAAPQVSGVAAIIAGLKPSITQREMEQLLCASAQDQVGDASDTPGFDPFYGFGRLNAKYALQIASSTNALPEAVNISTRGFVSGGDGVLIGGFILTGAHAKNVLVRAIGPSLGGNGVNGALADPTLELHDSSGQLIASNNDWRDTQQSDIALTGIAPKDNRESAIVRILKPGAYTAIVSGTGGTSGVALVEVYDLQATPNSKLANLSTRGFVGTDDKVLIGGFIVGATSNYVVRAIGPSLQNSGLTGALADPVLELRDSNGALFASNDDWMSDANSSQVQASGLAPTNARESALFVTFAAGQHTAIVRGQNDTIGVGLVEVYSLP